MSSKKELDDGIKSIKSAWRREHTARANLEKMLEQAEAEDAKLVVKLNAEHITRQNVEIENAKLRECLQDLAEHIREDDGFGLDYGWMLDRIREVGIEVNG